MRVPKTHAAFVILLVLLIAIGIFSARQSNGAVAASTSGSSSSMPNLSRACTSERTAFNNLWNVKTLEKTYQEALSAVFEERLDILKTPSKWVCPTSLRGSHDPPMPMLQGFANSLPGWSYEYRLPIVGLTLYREEKPVRFENFASIISEFRREYECRISELEEDVDKALLKNLDFDPFSAGFCCNHQNSCVPADLVSSCNGSVTMDPGCDGACSVRLESPDLLVRRESFLLKLEEAKTRARVAVDRSMLTIRSFEFNYAYARSLMCYARASLDLRNELNLLAESTSCMPKIWDALTSIHDRKK